MTKPTVSQLLSDPQLLRETAGRVLASPPPYRHSVAWSKDHDPKWHCTKCGVWALPTDTGDENNYRPQGCAIPDPAAGSESDIAEALVKEFAKPNLEGLNLFAAISEVWSFVTKQSVQLGDRDVDDMMWYILCATPAERIACCLVALGEATI